ncbi:MAG: response regulator [Candidatus Omnitrophica bacterium]|nr:response regulator [Candidatus Omnitrophota bacterium]
MKARPLTTGEMAHYCHVTYRTVLKWIEDGKLKAYRTPGKHSRVAAEEFVRFLRDYQMPIPEEFRSLAESKKILVVDDDKNMIKSLQRLLKNAGYNEIEAAFDGFEAGRKFFEFEPHLVLLDIRMPGIDGYHVVEHIKKSPHGHLAKIIAISAFFEEDKKAALFKQGVNFCFDKPFDPKDLVEKVKSLLGD